MSGPSTPPPLDAVELRRRLDRVHQRIADAGGDTGSITVVAVTKTFGPEVARLALEVGLADLGENYAQELWAKAAALDDDPPPGTAATPRWHFIGGLQRNKVKQVAERVSLWQSVDRLALGHEIAKRRPGASVLVQVNTTGEPAKSGCDPAEVASLVEAFSAGGLDVQGLMAVGPSDRTVDPRPAFAALRSLVDQLGLEVCSMGMSGDLEAAVTEGTTMVRVGTALFGSRDRTAGERQ